ncbi:MAG: hypothetical protein NTZ05_04115 [Chloroflexi bacterium]|nr:hypothetical protein [Chloroflexota bacterium]
MISVFDTFKGTEFGLYPTDYLIGVADTRAEAELTLEELVSAGFPKDALVALHGEQGAEGIDPAGERHGWLIEIWRTMQSMTVEGKLFGRYAVRATSLARSTLLRHGWNIPSARMRHCP